MINDQNEHQENDPTPTGPSQWETRPTKETPGQSLHHQIQGGDDVEYTAQEDQQVSYAADSQQSLHSKLKGGGRDLGEDSGEEETKLCPGCNAVTSFVQGVCSNCGYKTGKGDPLADPSIGAPVFHEGSPTDSPIARNVLIIAIIVVVLGIVGYMVSNSMKSTPSRADRQKAAEPVTANDTFGGDLNAINIDDAFHSRLVSALELGNEAWAAKGVDAYVYRYNIYEDKVPAKSQLVRISAFVGGDQARESIEGNGDEEFRQATLSFIQGLNDRAGVEASILLESTEGNEPPSPNDIYIRYGYYYGLEHLDEIQPVIKALESIKNSEGCYPISINETIVRPKIRTNGNLTFKPNGFGYVPIFKTDSNGNVIMGSGKGAKSFYPDEQIGYYLFVFLKTESEGLDFKSPSDEIHHREYISRFPYIPEGNIKNIPLEKDGKPDGIACVIHNGEFLKN